MVSRTQIDRLRSRIEALAPPAVEVVSEYPGGPKAELFRRLGQINSRMRTWAEERGEGWPPPLSPEEREDIIRRFRRLAERRTPGHEAFRPWGNNERLARYSLAEQVAMVVAADQADPAGVENG